MTYDKREHFGYHSAGVQANSDMMVLTINGVPYDAEYTVCPTCDGRGTHVNPDIDRHGLSHTDFDQDPDFREDYMRGVYDIECTTCKGQRVILVPTTAHGKAALEAAQEEERAYRAEVAAEIRMGA